MAKYTYRIKQRVNALDYRIQRGTITKIDGLTTPKLAVATFDTAALDSSGVSNKTVATHGLGVYLPIKAVITNAWYHVHTAFTSANSTAGIAFQSEAAGDLKAAVAVSDATLGTLGIKAAIPVGTAATMIALTAERELKAVVSTEVLVLGKATLFVEYQLSE
jgi:hypothetical protein